MSVGYFKDGEGKGFLTQYLWRQKKLLLSFGYPSKSEKNCS